jgi:hypothetical protein
MHARAGHGAPGAAQRAQDEPDGGLRPGQGGGVPGPAAGALLYIYYFIRYNGMLFNVIVYLVACDRAKVEEYRGLLRVRCIYAALSEIGCVIFFYAALYDFIIILYYLI